MKFSLTLFFLLPSLFLLSSVIGFSRLAELSNSRSHGQGSGGYTILGHQQQEMESGRVNETLWTTVVETALRKPFDWIQLSHALDTLDEDFQKRSSSLKSREEKQDFVLDSSSSLAIHQNSRPTFTYHRVLTFPRNGHKISAIAAVSASVPTSNLLKVSRTTTTLSSLDDEILSRLLLEKMKKNNDHQNGDNGRLRTSRDHLPLSTSSQKYFEEKWKKLSDHFDPDDHNDPNHSSNFFKNYPALSIYHPKRHEPSH